MKNMTAIVLAGGCSSRFGTNKAFADWKGKTLISHMLNILKPMFPTCLVVAKEPEEYESLSPYASIVKDFSTHSHPGVGILSGLYASGSSYNFLCGCDMPLIQEKFVMSLCEASPGYDAVIPVWRGNREPLCG